jgi:Domain of unknown function (DUF4304)
MPLQILFAALGLLLIVIGRPLALRRIGPTFAITFAILAAAGSLVLSVRSWRLANRLSRQRRTWVSEIGRVIDRIAADALTDPLKAAGYQKVGRTWRRRVTDAVQVVNVQASRHNLGADGRFTLNAGVYFPALAARLGVVPPTAAPEESDCHVHTRPMPPGRNWWKVRAPGATKPDEEGGRVLGAVFSWLDRWADRRASGTNDRATHELRQALERYALPWLDRVADLKGAREELIRHGPLWWAAAASLELDDHGAAARIFAQAVAAAAPGKADELRRWGRANGLET